jgi:hypothetical protein
VRREARGQRREVKGVRRLEADTVGNRPHPRNYRTSVSTTLVTYLLIITGCGLRLVSPYDANTQEHIFKCAKLVDQFYLELLEVDEGKRQYAKFADRYVAIEAELNSLVFRNKVRSLNEDSVDIAEGILKLWKKYEDRHKDKDAYSTGNAKLDQNRFARMFAYAARAEGAKKPSAGAE